MPDHQVLAIVRAVFVTQTDEDYAKVFDIFDTDSTGGIDQHEFHQITALLGNHASEAETRALFLSADTDCNGLLDVAEFTALLRSLSPAARSDDAHYVRTLMARQQAEREAGSRGPQVDFRARGGYNCLLQCPWSRANSKTRQRDFSGEFRR